MGKGPDPGPFLELPMVNSHILSFKVLTVAGVIECRWSINFPFIFSVNKNIVRAVFLNFSAKWSANVITFSASTTSSATSIIQQLLGSASSLFSRACFEMAGGIDIC